MIHFAGTLGFGNLASLAGDGSLFAGAARDKLEQLQAELRPLSERYDVVVANPPYMGSSSLGKWMGTWAKKHYPEAYRDLCTSFIDRGFTLSNDQGYSAMVTMQSWMFLGSYEKLRGKLLRNHTISSMTHLGTRAFGAIGGEVVSTTATVFANAKYETRGSYFRLVDMGSEEEKQARLLEALADPDCGWFYRADASSFKAIPCSPIVYWGGDAIKRAFRRGTTLENTMLFKTGMVTGDNEKFLRLWWETSQGDQCLSAKSNADAIISGKKWFPYNKGGEFRRWYGNNDYLINFRNEGAAIFDTAKEDKRAVTNMRPDLRFKTIVTWSLISSSLPAFRLKEYGFLYDKAGLSFYPQTRGDALYALGLCNSSFSVQILQCLAPTMNFQLGDIWRIPYFTDRPKSPLVEKLVEENISDSQSDWDSYETSWDFKKHPLI